MWTALMFDAAVNSYGRYIEAKLKEIDEDGNPVNTLRGLLDLEYSEQELRNMTRESLRLLEIEGRKPNSGIVLD